MKLHQSCRGFFPCPVPLRNFVLAAWMNETFWIPENIETYLEAEPRQEHYKYMIVYSIHIYININIYIYDIYIYIIIYIYTYFWCILPYELCHGPWTSPANFLMTSLWWICSKDPGPVRGITQIFLLPGLGFWKWGTYGHMGTPNLREFWCSHVFGPTRYDKMFGADGRHNLITIFEQL